MSDYSQTELNDINRLQKPGGFKSFLYNSDTKQVFGRTGKSWAQILFFYAIFYAALSGFFITMLLVFLEGVISYSKPMRTGQQSLLKFKPGIGFRPMPDYRSTLIHYAKTDPQSYGIFTEDISSYLKFYRDTNAKPDTNFAECKDDVKSPDDVDKVCKFPLETLGPCGKDKYGYDKGQPCVLLKMNKNYGWIPDVKNMSATKDILVRCAGQNEADSENMGPIDYYPRKTIDGIVYGYFSNLYYPYLGQSGYRTPLLGVHFTKPRPHTLAMVRCNVAHVKFLSEGVKFEILVD